MDGVCSACLCTGRTLCNINESSLYFVYKQILDEISACSLPVQAQLCWECVAIIRRWVRFKRCVRQAASQLMQRYPEDRCAPSPLSRLKTQAQFTDSYPAVNSWGMKYEVKVEELGDVLNLDNADYRDYDYSAETPSAALKCESPLAGDDVMPLAFANALDIPKVPEKKTKRKSKKLKVKLKKHRDVISTAKKKENTLATIHSQEQIDPVISEQTSVDQAICDEVNVDQTNVEQMKVESNHQCEECGVKFVRKKNLENHMVKHKKNVDDEEVSYKSSEKPFCNECQKPFSSQKTYKYHMSTLHGGQNRHECPLCSRVYQWKSNLARHLRTHKAVEAGELYCSLCDKKFASIATYRTHLAVSRRHISSDAMPFVCAECGARFTIKTRLRDHIDWEHLNKIKFKCDLCNKPFKSHTSLYIHMNNVHRNKGRKDHLCHICGKAYQNICKLRAHVAASHGAAPAHRCSGCGAAFSWHSSWYRHYRHCAPKSPSKKIASKPRIPNKMSTETDLLTSQTTHGF